MNEVVCLYQDGQVGLMRVMHIHPFIHIPIETRASWHVAEHDSVQGPRFDVRELALSRQTMYDGRPIYVEKPWTLTELAIRGDTPAHNKAQYYHSLRAELNEKHGTVAILDFDLRPRVCDVVDETKRRLLGQPLEQEARMLAGIRS